LSPVVLVDPLSQQLSPTFRVQVSTFDDRFWPVGDNPWPVLVCCPRDGARPAELDRTVPAAFLPFWPGRLWPGAVRVAFDVAPAVRRTRPGPADYLSEKEPTMPKLRPALETVKPYRLADVVEDLRSVDADVRKLAGVFELAADRGEALEWQQLLEVSARWLWCVAADIEHATTGLVAAGRGLGPVRAG
jgi:hypothetical protein